MKRSVWCIMLLALCLAVWPDTLVVYPNRGPTLQQTVDQARSGDTIRVGEGISLYNMHAKHGEWLEEYVCNGAVVSVLGSRRVEIVDCELNGCGAMGISLEDSQEIDIVGCLIQHNSFAAIYIYNTDSVYIIHSKILDNATTIAACQTSGLEMYGNVVAGNSWYGLSGE
jgi:parallel beta-helix repeat protein